VLLNLRKNEAGSHRMLSFALISDTKKPPAITLAAFKK
jgi:hypothetical protein